MVFMGIGTWYKYANRLGIRRKFFRIKRKKMIGIRVQNPASLTTKTGIADQLNNNIIHL